MSRRYLSELAERYRVRALGSRRFTHETYWGILRPYLQGGGVHSEVIGHSVEDRTLWALHFGEGKTRVLLWSQMHGDESTATRALADIVRFLAGGRGAALHERLRKELSVTIVPMLNPDGAETFTRRNAMGVDVNRDAQRLVTPEARALKSLYDRIAPEFAFNLHDQDARTIAGKDGRQVAVALLAPPADATGSFGVARQRARLLAATMASALEGGLRGRVARYEGTYSPRAFGDRFQAEGTSTVLVESGVLPDDPEKERLRSWNVFALLEALDAIATGRYQDADPSLYERLPENVRVEHDVILRGGKLTLSDGRAFDADVGICWADPVARRGVRLGEVGDLTDTEAIDVRDVSGLRVEVEMAGADSARLEPGAPAVITVRDGVGRVVYRFGAESE